MIATGCLFASAADTCDAGARVRSSPMMMTNVCGGTAAAVAAFAAAFAAAVAAAVDGGVVGGGGHDD